MFLLFYCNIKGNKLEINSYDLEREREREKENERIIYIKYSYGCVCMLECNMQCSEEKM